MSAPASASTLLHRPVSLAQRLNVCPETLEVLAKNGIKAEVFQSEAADRGCCRAL
jgi:hypothetical protein